MREETSCENSSVFRWTPFCKAKRLDLPRCWVIPTLAETGGEGAGAVATLI